MSLKTVRVIYRRSLSLVKSRQHGLAKAESGQVLIFFGVFALLFVLLVGSVANYGFVVRNKVEVQTSADSAALSAGMWIVRGGNLQQMINGIHWDINHTLGQIVSLSSGIAGIIITILLFFLPWTSGAISTVKNIENTILTVAANAHKVAEPTLTAMQSVIFTATPIMAMVAANGAAAENGASSLLPLFVDLFTLGWDQKDVNNVKNALEVVPLYTWTLSPSVVPWKDVQMQYKIKPTGWEDDVSKAHVYFLTPKSVQTPYMFIPIYWPTKITSLDWKDQFITSDGDYGGGDWSFPSLDLSLIDLNIPLPDLPNLKLPDLFDFNFPSINFNFPDLNLQFPDLDINLPDLPSLDFPDINLGLSDFMDQLKLMIRDILGSFTLGSIFWDFFSCTWSADEGDDDLSLSPPEDKDGNEPLREITFITGKRSEPGLFQKALSGSQFFKDPESSFPQNFVPPILGLSTVGIYGEPIHPGGLHRTYSNGDFEFDAIKTYLVPPIYFYTEPFSMLDRIVRGYEGNWSANLVPVKILKKPGKWVGIRH